MNVRRCCALLLLSATALLAGCGGGSSSSSSSASTTTSTGTSSASAGATGTVWTTASNQLGFEGIPIEPGPELAPTSTTTGTVDGITCLSREQLAYHIHAHLTVYVDGKATALPGGVGIPGSAEQNTKYGPVALGGTCIYFLHTHAPDGVIHVESPFLKLYTLANFFDVWHQPLSTKQVATAAGPVTAYVNGKLWKRDPRAIPLLPHNSIQLDVGSPTVPFQRVSWDGARL